MTRNSEDSNRVLARESAATLAALAMTRAEEAHTKVDSHEAICAERYSHIQTLIGNVEKGLGSVLKVLAWGGTTIFMICIGLISFLAIKAIDTVDVEADGLRTRIQELEASRQQRQDQRQVGQDERQIGQDRRQQQQDQR